MPASATPRPRLDRDHPHTPSRRPRPTDSPAAPANTNPRPGAAVCTSRAGVDRASDEELLGRFRDTGRPEDIEELVRRYSGGLGRHLARTLGDEALVEDVLQDVFLQVFLKSSGYRDGWPARSWLYAIASHRAVDALRRSRRMPAARIDGPCSGSDEDGRGGLREILATDEPSPAARLLEAERRLLVRRGMALLPGPLRQILVLAYDRGLPYAEIADMVGIPIGTVKSRLHSALLRLRDMGSLADISADR